MTDKRISILQGILAVANQNIRKFCNKAVPIKKKVAVVDLDIVNPYFRAVDAKVVIR